MLKILFFTSLCKRHMMKTYENPDIKRPAAGMPGGALQGGNPSLIF